MVSANLFSRTRMGDNLIIYTQQVSVSSWKGFPFSFTTLNRLSGLLKTALWDLFVCSWCLLSNIWIASFAFESSWYQGTSRLISVPTTIHLLRAETGSVIPTDLTSPLMIALAYLWAWSMALLRSFYTTCAQHISLCEIHLPVEGVTIRESDYFVDVLGVNVSS